MIFITIGFVILIYSLINYKRAFILFLAFKLFLVTNITLISVPGIPLLTLEDFMSIVFVFLFILKSKTLNKSRMCIPFQIPFIFLVISFSLSMIFSVAGISTEISQWIKIVINNILVITVIWNSVETKEDFDFAFKLITIVIFISCIYGLAEYALKSNPLTLYEQTLNKDSSKVISFIYENTSERGYRVNSIFEHAIGAGINWGLYFAFTLNYFINKKEPLPFSKLAFVTMCLCVVCMLLTKMRSGMLFTALATLGSLNFKKEKTYVLVTIGIILLFGVGSILDKNGIISKLFNSLFNGASVGGSTASMRFNQLGNAISLMKYSPVFGLGQKYRLVMSNQYIDGLLGTESVWFFVIPCFGILGVISWVIYFVYLVYKIPRYFRNRQAFFLALAYFVTYTMTSVPGIKMTMLYLFYFYFIKQSDTYDLYYDDDRNNEFQYNRFAFRKVY